MSNDNTILKYCQTSYMIADMLMKSLGKKGNGWNSFCSLQVRRSIKDRCLLTV